MTTGLYYDLVPKDPIENLKWRIRCRERALTDLRFRNAFWQACMDDVCFFMAAACIGEGTRVVTQRGPVPIENVTQFDLVWDGFDWVSQDGPVYKGHKPSIVAYEITVTPDHEIWTKNGWKPAVERHDRQEVWLPDDYTEKWKIQKHDKSSVALPMQVRKGKDDFWRQSSKRQKHELRLQVERSKSDARQNWKSSFCYLDWNDTKVHKQKLQALESIRRSRNNCLREVDEVREFLRRHGRSARKLIDRQNRQRRELRAWKLSMGNVVRADAESATAYYEKIRNSKRTDDHLRYNENHRNDTCWCFLSNQEWMDSRRVAFDSKHKAHVYDLLNCGPRQCFTVLDANDRPLLVHNCYGYDPRSKHKIVPFIPYPHQEKVFRALDEAIDYTSQNEKTLDVLVDKARAQGGTFGYLWVDLRRWLRDSMFSAGYVTRNADLVDSKTDSDTVLWKVQFAINMLPVWMRPKYERNLSQHTFENKENGSLLKGYAAGQDVAAGGRATVFTMDEAGAKDFVSGGKDYAVMEALHDVTNCLRLVSARYIDQGVFHEACEAGGSEGGWHLVLDWKDHPVHSRHSYIVRDNVPVACKPEDAEAVAEYHKSKPDLRELLEKKGYKYEGVVRSPWYDMRCLRKTARPQLIASQLDRNPKGAVGKVFSSDLLERMKKEHSKRPVWKGTPVFDSETLQLKGLIEREDGPLTLWFKPGIDNSPPLGPFTIACDIASGGTGAYASNSIASGMDKTGEQVLEYAVKGLEPRPFARIVVGLCLWMRKAKLGWEDSGVSSGFAKEVMEVLYYGNIFYRNVTQLGSQKKSRKPGFPCRDADKADMFEQFAIAMDQGKYIPRSSEMITECGEYEWDGAKIIHGPTKNKGATDKNHGDRAIAAAGAWLVYSTDNSPEKVDSGDQNDQNPEYGSFLWRERQERRNANTDSPRYGIRDVLRR